MRIYIYSCACGVAKETITTDGTGDPAHPGCEHQRTRCWASPADLAATAVPSPCSAAAVDQLDLLVEEWEEWAGGPVEWPVEVAT